MSKTKNGVATLTSAKKPSLKNIKAVIEAGITQVNEEFSMTQIIQQDLFTRDKKTNQTLLTKELNKLFESGQDEKIDKAKKWIKTRLQTLIKEKTVQELLLGEENNEIPSNYNRLYHRGVRIPQTDSVPYVVEFIRQFV